jgi:hypothetical protein
MDERDRSRAIELRRTIMATPSEALSLEQIKDYILYNCCTFAAPAGHRGTIVDDGNLMPLARRWQNEIWTRAGSQSILTSSVPAPPDNTFFAQHPPTTLATPTPTYTATNYTSTANPDHQLDPRAPWNINTAPSSSIASYTTHQYISSTPTTAGSLQQFPDQPRYDHYHYRSSLSHDPYNPTTFHHNSAFSDPITSSPSHKYSVQTVPATSEPLQDHWNQPYYDLGPRDAISGYQPNPRLSYDVTVPTSTSEFAPQLAGNLPHFPLRSREVNILNSILGQSASDSEPSQSEFCIYKAEPGPDDSVARKLLAPLEDDDFMTGSLYAFTRDSSPGHIKIGWTASPVNDRLNYWSNHGDDPKGLFSVHLVPHAQRAETLTHYELIKEWRWERRCKNQLCNVKHIEWFEVSKYRAKQVVADWAEFIERAEPYDPDDGSLKPSWRRVVETMDGKGELVTAKKLLEHYEASLVEEPTFIETSLVIAEPPVKVESLIKTGPLPKSESDDREALTPERSQVNALPKTPDPAALSSSPKPNVKEGSDSLSATRKELADARIDLKGVLETITSIMERLQNIELSIQAEPQREVLPRDRQIRAAAEQGRPHRQVESPATKNETEKRPDGWDPEETLVEDQSPHLLEKVALKIVDGISAGISAGKASAVEKRLDGPKVLELEALLPILPGVGAL